MSDVYIVAYVGKGGLFNKFIRFYTRERISHVELMVDNICYSSSAMDGGVRSKVINVDSDNWLKVKLNNVDSKRIIEYFEKTDTYKYGYLSLILNQLFNRNKPTKKSLFCSEWVMNALDIPDGSIYNPATCFRLTSHLFS